MLESPFKALYYCVIAFVVLVALGVVEHYVPIFQYAHEGFILLGNLIKMFLDSAVVRTVSEGIIKSIGGMF